MLLIGKIRRTDSPRTRSRQGLILITTLFFMLLFFLLSFAIYQLSPSENRTALRDKTLTQAHFACTAGLRVAKEWISAVSKADPSLGTTINSLGYDWAGGAPISIGTTVHVKAANDVFSVPNTDPNFNLVSLGSLSCPNSHFSGKTGVDFLGLRPDTNLTSSDYNAIKADQANWLALKTPDSKPINVGDYQVYVYIIPSADTMQQLTGATSLGLRSYLVTTVSYLSGSPVMRARCLLKEQSAADFAYRANKGGVDSMGNPVAWNIQDANSVLFDGPVHTNEVPWINVPQSYWNAALTYLTDEPLRPKRAFMGSLTFSGSNSTINSGLSFDGVGYLGGNYNGTSIDRRPFDNLGTPIASTAQGSNPDPPGGKIINRYDRMIEGGRQSIRKVAVVPLPADLVVLKTAAFGADSVTGLNTSDANPANWQVDPTQKNGSIQAASYTRPGYTNSSGAWVAPVSYNNSASKEVGLFVNPKSGSTQAAGGIAIKGTTRNMFLEVQDSGGNLVTNVSGLEAGSAAGNPVVRIQSMVDSYDADSGTNVTTYTQSGSSADVWHAPTADVWHPGTPAVWTAGVPGYTTPGTAGYTTPGVAGYTTPGASPAHSPVSTCPSPLYTPPSGGGSGTGTYSCPHSLPDVWHPATADVWHAGTPDVWHPAVAGYTTPAVAGYTTPGAAGYTTPGSPVYTPSGAVTTPFTYKAQDWVVDVKNVATVIPASIPLPTGAQSEAWQKGVGGVLTTGASSTKQAPLLGLTPDNDAATPGVQGQGITKVYVHNGSDTVGSLVSSPVSVPLGKIIVYKQSRSDANRVDAFILNRPAVPTTQQPGGTNGAVFGTGDITNLRGVNMDAKSIGVDYSTGKGLSIADSVWQYGTVRGQKPTTPHHGLGLVATKMNVQTRADTFASLGANLYIYATMIAGSSQAGNTGGLDVSQASGTDTTDFTRTANTTDTSATSRTLQIFGGLTEQVTKARLVGTTSGTKGWNQTMKFDKQLSYQPPPFFPTTATLVPLAYVQESVLGQ